MTASPVTEIVSDNPGLHLVAALQGYSDVYLNCRGIQHRWNMSIDMHIAESIDGGELVERHMVCENCETLRRERWLMRMDRWKVSRLETLGASYKYPEGYLMREMAMADHPREILRTEMFTRATRAKRRRKQ
jgi:hypothetical protein